MNDHKLKVLFGVVFLAGVAGLYQAYHVHQELMRSPAQEINEEEAIRFLDRRTANWLTSSVSHSDDGKCLSCHTTLSYSMVRPEYGESEELDMVKSAIEKRVKQFSDEGLRGGWYTSFAAGSLSTETIINSVSLISMDMARGSRLDSLTEESLRQLWQRQLKNGVNAGGFEWLDGFGLEPLETREAGYWGSSLLLSYLSDVPGYVERADVKENIKNLETYLKNNFDQQNLHNKLMAIEADQKFGTNFISPQKVEQTLNEVLSLAEPNGGWDLHRLIGRQGIGKADAYATSIVLKAFITVKKTADPRFTTGLKWLRNAQNLSVVNMQGISQQSCSTLVGSFFGQSVNHGGRTSLFMTDMATAFSLKALGMAKKAGL